MHNNWVCVLTARTIYYNSEEYEAAIRKTALRNKDNTHCCSRKSRYALRESGAGSGPMHWIHNRSLSTGSRENIWRENICWTLEWTSVAVLEWSKPRGNSSSGLDKLKSLCSLGRPSGRMLWWFSWTNWESRPLGDMMEGKRMKYSLEKDKPTEN